MVGMMNHKISILASFAVFTHLSFAQAEGSGFGGEPEAIELAQRMVEAMGGEEIWSQIQSVHFVHNWYPYHREDVYLENEILDLTGPRSWVDMKSEIYHRVRAYSPEFFYWSHENGELSTDKGKRFENAISRAPFNLYRLARAIARDDPSYAVTLTDGDIPGSQQLQFSGPDGEVGGYVILNARHEPLVWATNQYRYTFGPMKQFGSVRLPNWAVYENGATLYEMVSFTASNQVPDITLFAPPASESEK